MKGMNEVIVLLRGLEESLGSEYRSLIGQGEADKLSKKCQEAVTFLESGSHRRRLPRDRRAIGHKFEFGHDKETGRPHKGYIHVGFFEDDAPGEIFISMAKTGSTVSGVLDCLAIVVSMALQHGVPLKTICDKLTHTRYEPDGFSGEEFGFAKSITDYLFRWLEARYVMPERKSVEPAEDNSKADR
jgi:ribonucleoside-diphosphate reductase alpha chain